MSSQSYPGLLLKLHKVPWSNRVIRRKWRGIIEGQERVEILLRWGGDGCWWAMGSGDPLLFCSLVQVDDVSEGWPHSALGRLRSCHQGLQQRQSPLTKPPPSLLSFGTESLSNFKTGQWEHQKRSREERDWKSFPHFLIPPLLPDSGVNQGDKGTPVMIVLDFFCQLRGVEMDFSWYKENKDNKTWTPKCGGLRLNLLYG